MQLPNDPTQYWRARIRLTYGVGLVVTAGCAVWAFGSLRHETPKIALQQPQTVLPTTTNEPVNSLDTVAAFASARLWNPPPPAAVVEEIAKADSKPLRLQLIGILRVDNPGSEQAGSEEFKAAIYDQDDDRLLIVSSGQSIKQHKVTRISAKSVELSDGHSNRLLRLEESGS